MGKKRRIKSKPVTKEQKAPSPISQLPAEILCHIFRCVKPFKAFPYQHSYSLPYRWSLQWVVAITHVCRTWRYLGVNDPLLWTHISLDHSSWIKEMLIRSKKAALTVDLNLPLFTYGAETKMSLAEEILDQFSRIERLAVTGTQAQLQELFFNLPQSAPNLYSIVIQSYITWQQDFPLKLPVNCLSRMDKLRQFEFRGCVINWNIHLSKKMFLTTLKIHDVPFTSRPTRDHFWSVLRQMPLLEHLDIRDALPVVYETKDFVSLPSPKVNFSHLQDLTLSSSSQEVEFFLTGISLPPGTILDILCRGQNHESFLKILELLSLAISQQEMHMNEMHLHARKSHSEYTLRLEAFSSPPSNSGASGSLNVSRPLKTTNEERRLLKLAFFMNPALGRNPQVPTEIERLWVIISSLILQPSSTKGLQKVTYAIGDGEISSDVLTTTLGLLQELQDLELTYPPILAREMLTSLGRLLMTNISDSRGRSLYSIDRPTFPRLRQLTLLGADFDLYDGTEWEIPTFFECLKKRQDRGCKLQTLVLRECRGMSDRALMLLQKVVDNLDWDRQPKLYSANDLDDEYI